MGTVPIGDTFWEGPIKVVNVTWYGVDLGKTIGDSELNKIEDFKDILFAQTGTQYSDKVPTGQAWEFVCTLGELTPARLALLHDAITLSGGGKSVKVAKKIYHSLYEQAQEFTATAIDGDGDSSADPYQRLIAPKAYPMITGNFPMGPDTQRGLQITFVFFWDQTEKVFFYSGYPSSLGLTP